MQLSKRIRFMVISLVALSTSSHAQDTHPTFKSTHECMTILAKKFWDNSVPPPYHLNPSRTPRFVGNTDEKNNIKITIIPVLAQAENESTPKPGRLIISETKGVVVVLRCPEGSNEDCKKIDVSKWQSETDEALRTSVYHALSSELQAYYDSAVNCFFNCKSGSTDIDILLKRNKEITDGCRNLGTYRGKTVSGSALDLMLQKFKNLDTQTKNSIEQRREDKEPKTPSQKTKDNGPSEMAPAD